jgi:hypothetical protein
MCSSDMRPDTASYGTMPIVGPNPEIILGSRVRLISSSSSDDYGVQ